MLYIQLIYLFICEILSQEQNETNQRILKKKYKVPSWESEIFHGFIYFLSIKCTERVYPILIKNNTLARNIFENVELGFDSDKMMKTKSKPLKWMIVGAYGVFMSVQNRAGVTGGIRGCRIWTFIKTHDCLPRHSRTHKPITDVVGLLHTSGLLGFQNRTTQTGVS